MALSMDEQRALAEIERRLTADDPGLATCLTAFRRPGPANVLRSPRARIIGSLFTVLLVAMVSLMVYAMIPFRAHVSRAPSTAAPANVGISAAGSTPDKSTAASASTSTTSAGTSSRPSTSPDTTAAKNQATKAKTRETGQATASATGP